MKLSSAINRIFVFFFKQELKSKRFRIFSIISFIPVIIIIISKIVELSQAHPEVTAIHIFSKAILTTYIQFLVPLLALFFGSSVINEEVDDQTLVFLTTSPIPRPVILIGKFFAFLLLGIIIINIGLLLCFLIVNIDQLGSIKNIKEFSGFLMVDLLALVAYMSLFTLLGTFMKKAGVVLGVLFIFGWESVVQYAPGLTQKFTVAHWLKSLLPRVSGDSSFLKVLIFRLEPTTPWESLLVLSVFVICMLVLASIIFNKKEYVHSETV